MLAETRQEKIISTVSDILKGSTYASGNVFINKGDSLELSSLPAILIEQGPITPLGDLPTINIGFYDADIDVDIIILADTEFDEPLTMANNIHAQVHKALLVDHTLGLSFVASIYPDGAAAPSVEQAGRTIVQLTTRWFIRFRQEYTDIGLI